jgi:hypothetical protein
MNPPRIPQENIYLSHKTVGISSYDGWSGLLLSRKEIMDKFPDAKDSEIELHHQSVYDCDEYYLSFHRSVPNHNYKAEMVEYKLRLKNYEAFKKEVAELAKRYQ